MEFVDDGVHESAGLKQERHIQTKLDARGDPDARLQRGPQRLAVHDEGGPRGLRVRHHLQDPQRHEAAIRRVPVVELDQVVGRHHGVHVGRADRESRPEGRLERGPRRRLVQEQELEGERVANGKRVVEVGGERKPGKQECDPETRADAHEPGEGSTIRRDDSRPGRRRHLTGGGG